jgi:carboxymethylenebutenolidase
MGAIIRLDERHARAYVAEPAGSPRGRVLVLHDAFGLLPHVRFLCDELAANDFVALAPDLFEGTSTRSATDASRLLEQLSSARAERLLASAIRGFDAIGHTAGPDAAIGFSIGAEFGFGLAAGDRIQAMVSYYAMPSAGDAAALAIPLLAHWSEHDDWDSDARPVDLVTELKQRGVDVESYLYPGSRHGFANADIGAFDLDAAEHAWQRTVTFLTDRLRAA